MQEYKKYFSKNLARVLNQNKDFPFLYHGHSLIFHWPKNDSQASHWKWLCMVHISIISPGPLRVLQVVVYFTRFYSTSECSGQAISFPNGACNGLFGLLARELRARYFLMFWFHPKEVTLPEHGPPLKVWVPSPWDSCNQINRSRVYFTTRIYAFLPSYSGRELRGQLY